MRAPCRSTAVPHDSERMFGIKQAATYPDAFPAHRAFTPCARFRTRIVPMARLKILRFPVIYR